MPVTSAQPRVAYRFGPLEGVRSLGRGLTGEVFEARNPAGQRFVVKRLRPHLCGHVDVQRFLRESKIMLRLAHPNIMPVLRVESNAAPPFFVMPLVPGQAIAEVLAERGRLPVSLAARIAADVARGLAQAHAVGIVHRDVKPANLYLAASGNTLVFDFGLAKVTGDESLTATGSILGTPAYMAPEQIRGGSVDGRTDVYSLGVTIYELILGKNPFLAADMIETLRSQLEDMPRRLDALVPHKVPTELGELIHRMMAKDPDHCPSARACVETFGAFAQRQERAAAEPTRVSVRPKVA